jgi:hypothetical protein
MPAKYESRTNWALCYPKKASEEGWKADWTGVTVIDGQKFWVNVWEKIATNGDLLLSINIRPKEER